MSTILDSALWIMHDLSSAHERNQLFQRNTDNLAHFGAQLLAYDSIVIPTKDFGIVPMVANWAGVRGLRKLLDSGSLRFVWRKSIHGYAPNGGGLTTYAIERPKDGWENAWQVARWGEMEEAAEAQVDVSFPELDAAERGRMVTQVLALSSESPSLSVGQAAYGDVQAIPSLRRFVIEHQPPNEPIDLKSLKGIEANQYRAASHEVNDAIGLLLRVAELNWELMLATEFDGTDLNTSRGAEALMRSKVAQLGIHKTQLDGLVELMDLSGIPDIRPALATGAWPLEELIDFREKAIARQFRDWLASDQGVDPDAFGRKYVELVHPRAKNAPYRQLTGAILNFGPSVAGGAVAIAAGTLLGPLGPFVGPVAGVSTAVLLTSGKLLAQTWLDRSRAPRLFFDHLRTIPGGSADDDGADE